jgi:general secretion pathway protein K
VNGSQSTRGVALITAILITALATAVATGLMWDTTLDMRRTTVGLYRDQAVQVALGAEDWLELILKQDLEDNQTDHLGEIWAAELPGLPIDGGELFGAVEDLQGRFNVNNLVGQDGQVDEDSRLQFERLLAALGLDIRFAGLAADWIDADENAGFPNGAEDPIYTGFAPPYRTPNHMLSSASELAALEGMDKATLDILLPHIVALPGRTDINANTATAAVLQSLDENITPADVEGLLTQRADAGFADLNAAFATLAPQAYGNGLIAESTRFFQLKLVVRIDNVRITYFSVLERSPNGDVTPILRSIGTT